MRCSFRPYEGKEKYIFISYAHKDGDLVKPILEKMYEAGFRIWYDDGIEWGTEWSDSIAKHIKKCEVCIAFHSKNSINSDNCKHEIRYSLKHKKGILSVYLEEALLPEGIEMDLSPYQQTFWYQYSSEDKGLFFERLLLTEILQPCKGEVPKPEHAAENTETLSVTAEIAAETKDAEGREAEDEMVYTIPTGTYIPTECSENAEDEIVKFHDADFEKAFREKYRIKGNITVKMIHYIKEMNLSDMDPKLRDISDIAMFQNLKSLDLHGNEISDLTPLAGLVKLTELHLNSNKISDLTLLAKLMNLTKLYLDSNEITALKPLAGLMNLTELHLENNQISDLYLPPLTGLVNLTELNLSGNLINDITPLRKLVNLTNLFIRDNQISDITPLVGLVNLTELHLDRNEISDLTPLAKLVNLTKLNLECNRISDLTPLAGLAKLTELDLSRNQIMDIVPLAGLVNLIKLYLNSNQIRDISPLVGFVTWFDLELSYNKINDTTLPAGLVNLTELNLSYNQIRDISPLAELVRLTQLWLCGNQISYTQRRKLKKYLSNTEIRW